MVTIIGLERNRKLLRSAKAGSVVAALVSGFQPALVADGLNRRADGSYVVRSLKLVGKPRT